jgi:hypothetical protein
MLSFIHVSLKVLTPKSFISLECRDNCQFTQLSRFDRLPKTWQRIASGELCKAKATFIGFFVIAWQQAVIRFCLQSIPTHNESCIKLSTSSIINGGKKKTPTSEELKLQVFQRT